MASASAAGALRQLLELERQCCADLAALLERERAAVLTHDLDALLGTVRDREALQARWDAIGHRRARAIAQAGVVLRDIARGDTELTKLVDDLERETASLRSAQAINQGLVRGVLASVTELLAEVRRVLPGATYGRDACLDAPLREHGTSGWSA